MERLSEQPLLASLSHDEDVPPVTQPLHVHWARGGARYSGPSWRCSWLMVAITAVLSCWTTYQFDRLSHSQRDRMSDDHEYNETPSILSTIDRSWHMERFHPFNYSTSPWTEDPRLVGKNVDHMWHQTLGLDGTFFMIPKSEAGAFDLNETLHAIVPESESGLGEDAYLAWFEYLHLLHCLNGIRKLLVYNHEFYKEEDGEVEEMDTIHSNHCLDALRASIMCKADVNVIPHIWVWDSIKHKATHLPDFERLHRCHDYDAIRQWVYDNQLPERLLNKDVSMLPGQVPVYLDKRPRPL